MAWTLVYTHTGEGTRVFGDIETLINAVQNGASLKVLVETPAIEKELGYSFIFVPHTMHVRNGVVFAMNTLTVGANFEGDRLIFDEDSFYYMIIANTNGVLEQIRWDVGQHTPRGHNQTCFGMKWFVD